MLDRLGFSDTVSRGQPTREARRLEARARTRQKKRSGWKHPLDPNRNGRRCMRRRRSATAQVRRALQALLAAEMMLELEEARRAVPLTRCGRPHGGPKRRPARGLESRRAW